MRTSVPPWVARVGAGRERCLAARMDHYHSKPLCPGALEAAYDPTRLALAPELGAPG